MGMYHTNVSMKHHIYPWLPVAQNAPLSGCHEVWGTRLAPPFFQEDLWAGRWQIPFDMQWYMHIIHNICLYLSMYLFTCLFRYIYIYIAYIRTYNCVRVYHNTYIYIYTILMYISTNHWACYFIMVWFHLPMRRRFLRPFYVLRCNGCRSADSRMW